LTQKYSDILIDQLVELGYTHCFFVGGGNVMHILESARTRMTCVPVVNEVSAGIAAEYFNVAKRSVGQRAVAVVTAGPGLTNLVTAIGAAWLESRELLVIGGQARTEFLSRGTVRQIGHQEIDGVSITQPITKKSVRIEKPMKFSELRDYVEESKSGRKGPVFLELCLDVSAQFVAIEEEQIRDNQALKEASSRGIEELPQVLDLWMKSSRPLMLVGQGLSFDCFQSKRSELSELGVPVATSWNASDYLSYDDPLYAGRPNTYGMRWSNAAIQQADLLLVIGARLGLQQTGFNWQDFAPLAKIIHVEIDPAELEKKNPGSDIRILGDANHVFPTLVDSLLKIEAVPKKDWLHYIAKLKKLLPVSETANQIYDDYANPFSVIEDLSKLMPPDSALIPCSSGGSYTTVMQSFMQKEGQLLTNSKGSASMGYGLAGAIGTAFAVPGKKVVLVEGDGGFAQNISEIGTVANRNLNLKMIIFSNQGYASIRLSQKAYFDGNYIGCDSETGVGLPDWVKIFAAYGIPSIEIFQNISESGEALKLFTDLGPAAIIVNINQEQPFYPKLTSRIFPDGTMRSNPIHLMYPPLDEELSQKVFQFLPESLRFA
jgi:acetolactate synthase-1/2/3 large subunit